MRAGGSARPGGARGAAGLPAGSRPADEGAAARAPAPLLARLAALLPDSSRRRLRQVLADGRVRVNGAVVRDGRMLVTATDRVELGPGTGRPLPPSLALVHEDDDLLVIDKPPGLLTIATERERGRTAYRLVRDYLASRRPPGRPFVVHRLDRETSGLLVVAKSPDARRRLQAQFAARTVERRYVAVVEGTVSRDQGTLESVLVEDRALRVRSLGRGRAGRLPAGGRVAVTHYRVLARRPHTTVLELILGTGRRRQIRVQLAELGHPIVGDLAHGARARRAGGLALHATRLGFVHPRTGRPVAFDSPPPPRFGPVPAAGSRGVGHETPGPEDAGISTGRRSRPGAPPDR